MRLQTANGDQRCVAAYRTNLVIRLAGTQLYRGLLVLVLVLIPLLSKADDSPYSRDIRKVILLRVANDDRTSEMENQFATQLKLELDTVEIEEVYFKNKDFSSLVLKENLDIIKGLMEKKAILASLWIGEGKENDVLLHIVSLSANSAFVRVVSIPKGPNRIQELAFSTEVLLMQTYSMASTEKEKPIEQPPQARIVKEVSIDFEENTQKPDALRFGVMPRFHLNISDPQSFVLMGGGLLLELQFRRTFFGGLFVTGQGGPSVKSASAEVSGWLLQLGIEFGYRWTLGKLKLGPLARVAPYRYAIQFTPNDGGEEKRTRWDLVSCLGLDLRFPVARHLEIGLDAALGIHSHTRDFRLEDGTTILSLPRFDAQVSLGALIVY
jgi:hypothetical protein